MSSFLEINKLVIKELEENFKEYPGSPTFHEAYTRDPKGFGSTIRVFGLRCSECGGLVSGPNFKFYEFRPEVKCYTCQHNS